MLFIYILFIHWLADFGLQRRKDAENKSKSNRALTNHVLTYGLALTLATIWWTSPLFIVLNVVSHWWIDRVTSLISKDMYESKQMKGFWMTIGFDQFLHVAILYITFNI